MKRFNENIQNLTSLWKAVGTLAGAYNEYGNFRISRVPESQWPNRIWLEDAVNKKLSISNEPLNDVKQLIEQSEQPLAVSYWEAPADGQMHLFDRSGLSLAFEQIGMSMPLTEKFDHHNRIALKKVTTARDASIWEDLYPQSFGYVISADTVTLTMAQVDYYLIYLDDTAIGTVIVFERGTTVGFHGMGIIPPYRKQGFAEEAMCCLLNRMIDRGKTLATLQASAMGKNTYKKIGFSEDFPMLTYVLK